MEPQLIDKKILKKLLRKGYTQTDAKYNSDKKIKEACDIVKKHWYIILLVLFIIVIFMNLYSHHKKKKSVKKEKFESLEYTEIQEEPTFGHEGEYYKMLPRVTNSPNIVPYMY